MVRCTWDRADIQVAEQTAHPTAVRAGDRVFSSNARTQIDEEPEFLVTAMAMPPALVLAAMTIDTLQPFATGLYQPEATPVRLIAIATGVGLLISLLTTTTASTNRFHQAPSAFVR